MTPSEAKAKVLAKWPYADDSWSIIVHQWRVRTRFRVGDILGEGQTQDAAWLDAHAGGEQVTDMPKCHDCGRFMVVHAGTPWKQVYSGCPPTPDREIYRCDKCAEKNGTFNPQYGIRPEFSCGVVKREESK